MTPLMKSYLMPWCGAPIIGTVDADTALIAHAFGRNNIPDNQAFSKISRLKGGSTDVESVFKKLKHRSFDIGRPNFMLVRECISLIKKHDIRLCILQWELAYGLWHANADLYRSISVYVIWPDGEYLAAREFSLIVAHLCKRNRIRKTVSVAHKGMAVRAALILGKAFDEVGADVFLSIPEQRTASFDRKSVQLWTRGPVVWMIREILVRIHHLINDWV
jgi:hypothetical protein